MKLDDLKKLHQKKYRDEFGCFLVEGEHLVLELQKAASRDPRLAGCEVYVTHEYENWHGPFPTHRINSTQMAQLSETRTPQGIIARVPHLPATPPRQGETCMKRKTPAIWARFCVRSPGSAIFAA
jgi:TrmH family RNA methyltransferase